MSLLDALLLDPYRINVWIAYRTDSVKGRVRRTIHGTAVRRQDCHYSPGRISCLNGLEIRSRLSSTNRELCLHHLDQLFPAASSSALQRRYF